MKTYLAQLSRFQKSSLMLALALGVFLLPFGANAAIFMKIDGIDGEATDSNHDKWIDVLSVSEGISVPDSGGASGGTRRRADAVFDDIVVGKQLDKTSPKLREAVAGGQIYPRVEIELTRTCDHEQVTYFKWDLKNALVTQVMLSAADDGSRGSESLSLNFEEIKWTYTELDDACRVKGNVEASWKIEEGVP